METTENKGKALSSTLLKMKVSLQSKPQKVHAKGCTSIASIKERKIQSWL
jgi:hypothetical protein